MAWADDVPFDKIKKDYNITESDVIKIMRSHLKSNSFKLWRKRVSGRKSKHSKKQKTLINTTDLSIHNIMGQYYAEND
jgi:uncharacterized protein (TIGR03643 family)